MKYNNLTVEGNALVIFLYETSNRVSSACRRAWNEVLPAGFKRGEKGA